MAKTMEATTVNPRETVTVISFGAGVQSTAMILMSDRGEIPRAEVAIFADTGVEPRYVYDWLAKIRTLVSIPIVIVTAGNYEEHLRARMADGKHFRSPPLFTRGPNGDGIVMRQCTSNFKIRPIRSYLHKNFKGKHVNQMIGISTDEAMRMRDSRYVHTSNVYPLIDLRMTRGDCSRYVEEIVGEKPARSACWLCPFHSDAEWSALKRRDPEAFAKAVSLDATIRNRPGMPVEYYLHKSRRPLAELPFENADELNLFGNECEGMCGV